MGTTRAHRGALRQATADAVEGAARVVRATRIPTRKTILDFLTHQVLVNSVAWTAGLIAAGVVTSLYEVRGLRNLWGVAASGSRTLVSGEDYHSIMTVTSFSAGLFRPLGARAGRARSLGRSLRARRLTRTGLRRLGGRSRGLNES